MHYGFFIDEPGLRDEAFGCLQDDARGARLSPAFRAYYSVRALLPIALRQVLQRRRRVDAARDWYLPEFFSHRLLRRLDERDDPIRIVHPWPNGARYAVVLTHDVETRDGLRDVEKIAAIEEELGFRSSWNIVPYKYDTDLGLVRDLVKRGFEIGVHGYNHDGRLYLSRRIFENRVPLINAALARFGAVGFRSPMVHRNLDWLQALDIAYDASCFDVDPYQAMPGGVGGMWPFQYGKFVELPYTLPQDHTLFIALGLRDTDIWASKLQYVIQRRAMALMLTHPDYLATPGRRDLYRRFLLHIRERAGYWHALPREVAEWWRARESSRAEQTGDGGWTVTGPAAGQGVCASVQAGEQQLLIRVET